VVTEGLPPAIPTINVVECWNFRVNGDGRLEVLLMRRSAGRIFAGLWQPVTGRPEPGELAPQTALREVEEETGLGWAAIEGFYTLDQVVQLYAAARNGVSHLVLFAARVHPDAEIRIAHEHDDQRWVTAGEAAELAIWPAYRESLARIERIAADPGHAYWFELDATGRRTAV
jgi:8-oxo-dGTP pyrophosphatase MutT (NUDIX family)